MADQLVYTATAAEGYDRTFGCHVSARFVPALLNAARLVPGMHVLDVATGTGLAAEAALSAIGPTGHITAADLSPAMLGKARERLGRHPNASCAVKAGRRLDRAGLRRTTRASTQRSPRGGPPRPRRYRRRNRDRLSDPACQWVALGPGSASPPGPRWTG
jgi:hypothetical protein